MSTELKDTKLFKDAELKGFIPVVPALRVRELDVQTAVGADADTAIANVFIKIGTEKVNNCFIYKVETFYNGTNITCCLWYFVNR